MLAFIGFVVLLLVATGFLALAVFVWFASKMLGWNKGDRLVVGVNMSVGSFFLWLAFHLAPFSISFTG